MRTTRYAKTADGVHIAYQVFGDGPHDLVIHPPWLFNVDACWDFPEMAAFLESFGRYARVILFDRRGFGVSDRPTSPDVMAVEKGMEDIRTVIDAVGSERAVLLGYEAGAAVMLLFAASFPIGSRRSAWWRRSCSTGRRMTSRGDGRRRRMPSSGAASRPDGAPRSSGAGTWSR
jgi:pimeloyl-ACP methyl ester carboxylesterase